MRGAGGSPPSDGLRQLGHYRLIMQLAVGGMAEIYVAQAAGVGGFEKLVALKVIHPNYSEDPEFVQMLVDEAKLAVQLSHANIVQTFDLGCVDQQYYIAMELIDGADLYKLLRTASEKEIDFPFDIAAFIASEVSNGLDYAHRKRDPKGRPLQIVHRDVSPQNVLVSSEGMVKIVDFGIAKAALRSRQTAAGVIKGKYYYMSPEQAWGDPIDARTDVFSTGILLYEMLVGQMLYLEEDLETLLAKVRKADIPLPSTKRRGMPAELEQIVMKALKKRTQDRYQSAQELSQALTAWLRKTAPDFNRAHVAGFVREVLGPVEEQTTQSRDKRVATAHTREMLERDENSLLFKLSDYQPPAPAPPPPRPRLRDEATNPVALPAMKQQLRDFEESDRTVVDAGDTLLASLDQTPGKPPPKLGADPAEDDATSMFGGDEATIAGDLTPSSSSTLEHVRQLPTAREIPHVREDEAPPLPGVRKSLQPPPPDSDASLVTTRKSRKRQSPPSLPLVPQEVDDDEATAQHRKPARRPANVPIPTSGVSSAEDTTPPVVVGVAVVRSAIVHDSAPTPLPATPVGAKKDPTPLRAPSYKPPTHHDEPTHIPPPAPPPVQSGVYDPSSSPTFDDAPFAAPFGDGAPVEAFSTSQVPKSRPLNRPLLVAGAVAIVAALVTVALSLTGTGRTRATLEVVSLPPGAEVNLDGTALESATPLEITAVDPQVPHHVRVSMRGFDVWESDVRFEGTRRVRLQAVLVPAVGSLTLTSNPPGAEAIVNGRIRGLTPVTVGDLPPNDEIAIEIRLRGYKVAHDVVKFGGKRELSLTIPLEKAK
jgi:serine/threonine-protein kinase